MNILVIGDIMLDINYISKIERNAPEANIPIHLITETNYFLGGASNVAYNLKNLETNVELISVIGNDHYGSKIKELLDLKIIKHKLFIDIERKTNQINRIIHNVQVTVRYDVEDIVDIDHTIAIQILEYIKLKQLKEPTNAIIISDYDKGVISQELCQQIIKYANENNIYTFVDPKIKNYIKYKGCFCFKPNLIEGEIISGQKNIIDILDFIKQHIQCQNIVLTQGKDGILVNNIDNINNIIKHSEQISVIDVTGAGDTVMSVLVYIFIQYKDIHLATKIANYIAGKSVQTIGNYITNKLVVKEYLDQNKIICDYEIDRITSLSNLKNVVFTNGCFDILHTAHIQLLQFSKKQGDVLVVGLNSDDSIKRLKGTTRPINNIDERAKMLSLFDFIDYIIIFREDTPLSIIQLLKPNILIKGSDYKKEDIIGKEFANEIILFDFIKNKSTSLIINKITNK